MPNNRIDLSKPPYHSLFDPLKGYTKVLTRPGRPAQSREIIELQDMLSHQIQSVGNAIMKDGAIISGCTVTTHGDGKAVTVEAGQIYVGGQILAVERTTLPISGSGKETINVAIEEKVVTADEDWSLRDPATGMGNYGQEGADRLHQKAVLVANDSDLPTIYTLIDGGQYMEEASTPDVFTEHLARRSYDENGNFVVYGLKIVDSGRSDDNFIYTTVENGKAYVHGYEVTKPSPTQLGHRRPVSTRATLHEPKVFNSGVSTYALNNNPVAKVNQMVITVEVTQNITRNGIAGGIDALPLFPVVAVSSVKQGGTTYNQPNDYMLNGDGIDWSPSGIEPAIGSSYQVTWRYTYVAQQGLDYDLEPRPDTNTLWIQFRTTAQGATLPANGTQFTISYEFMLARKDAIVIDNKGEISIIEGEPDTEIKCMTPHVDDPNLLFLGSVLLRPNNDVPIIFNRPITRLTVADMYNVLSRLNDMEYNQAVDNLDREAMDGEPATLLKGILTDGFLGFTKSDVTHGDFSAAIDINERECTMSSEEEYHELDPDKAQYTNIRRWGNGTSTLDFTEAVAVSQLLATGSMKINEYQSFPQKPILTKLTPNVDNWVETSQVYIDGGTRVTTMNLRRWWLGGNSVWSASEKAAWEALNAGSSAEAQRQSGANQVTLTTSSVSSYVLDEAIQFMRQTKVQFEADRFPAFENNLRGTFDGRNVTLTPQSQSYQGTEPGTLRADNTGKVLGSFTVPTQVQCGTREFLLKNQDDSLICGANYTANGRRLTTVTTTTRFQTVVNFTTQIQQPVDPLAQTIFFERDRVLTSVGLFFANKDPVNPVTVMVRDTVNGYPGTTVYAIVVLQPSECVVSQNGTAETKVVFPSPVYVKGGESLSICVMTESAVDSLYVAKMGEYNIQNAQEQCIANPYLDGVLFSSSNNMAWTPHQNMDMKFKLYTANFAPSGSIVWPEVSGLTISGLLLLANYVNPARTKLTFDVNLDDTGWKPIWDYDELELAQTSSKVQFRCNLSTTEFSSPALNMDSVGFIGFLNSLASNYVSKNVQTLQPFNNVKQVCDIFNPSGTGFIMEYATDQNGNVWTPTPVVDQTGIGNGWSRFSFEKTLPAEASNYRVRIRLTTTNPCIRPRVKNLMSILKKM